ncbi:hypothetical protein [Dulcicalothrix desertica]|uniref:hypothetical protein n=1 Tax=Dulcicalothrix desertica TaxID=32056 RepID=UPI001F492244|nr:hypothetical protein [Dulcicalothrix desertica]
MTRIAGAQYRNLVIDQGSFIEPSQFADPRLRGASTHSRVGDWEVMRVEQYPSGQPDSDFETIVICYYRYSPVTTPLKPLSKIQTTQAL